MAALTSDEIMEILEGLMEEGRFGANITKPEIKQAISDVDAWFELNRTSWELAMDLAFRNASSKNEEMFILAYIARKKAGEYVCKRTRRENQ